MLIVGTERSVDIFLGQHPRPRAQLRHVRDEQLFAALAISAQRSIADFSIMVGEGP